MLVSSVAAYRAAYRNGRAVNWYSTTRIHALCAYDWIWEALTPEERKAIIVPLVQHVEDVQPGAGKPFIIRRNVGNIQSGFYSVRSLLWPRVRPAAPRTRPLPRDGEVPQRRRGR